MDYYKDILKNKYAVFEGRARRKEYWMFFLWNLIISIVVNIVGGIFGLTLSNDTNILGALYSLAILIPSLAVTSRRLHDTNRSAWWMLLWFIPIVGWIIMLVFLVTDSQPGANQYGPSPKEVVPVPTV